MCKSPIYWCRTWAVWCLAFLITGAALDTLALTQHGYPATLTAHIRRWTGTEPVRFCRAGTVGVIAFLGWALLHLGFGILNPGQKWQKPNGSQ